MYPGRDLNPYGRDGHWILSPACLPIPPPGPIIVHDSLNGTLSNIKRNGVQSLRRDRMSERRDSNPRPRPWQGRALPAELLSLFPEMGLTKIEIFSRNPKVFHFLDSRQWLGQCLAEMDNHGGTLTHGFCHHHIPKRIAPPREPFQYPTQNVGFEIDS